MSGDRQSARTGEVARALGLSNATVQAYARAGRIPFRLTPGKQYRFNVADVRTVLGQGDLVAENLVDVLHTPGVIVDELTGFRGDAMSDAALSRLRIRGVRPEPRRAARELHPGDGSQALTALVRSSQGVAVAVLHRDLARA